MAAYCARRDRLVEQLKAGVGDVRLAKATSNLFRDRAPASGVRLDVRAFNRVLDVDREACTIEVEGMATYEDIVRAGLEHGLIPCVVPQLKTITLGGAISGVGIESSSFRYGLVHETIAEMEVLLGDGSVVTCRPDNEHRALFYGLPNAYGTLGYMLRVRAAAIRVRPYVQLKHIRLRDAETLFAEIDRLCREPIDFLDGVVFGRDDYVLTVGRMVDAAPYLSDYTYERIYYRSLRARSEDYLTIADYLWRWDTDWFWCSKNVGAQHPLVRRLFGRRRLGSRTYTRIMRWNTRVGLVRRLERLLGYASESVIQDVDIPLPRAREFLDFYLENVPILPAWLCPIRAHRPDAVYPLYRLDPVTPYVNFGFWDVVRHRGEHAPGHFNKLIEREVTALGGLKSLYSDSYFSEEQFWSSYDHRAYLALKARYDPHGRLGDLYRKCVLRA